MFRALADSRDENAGREGVEGASVADLHVETLGAAALALVGAFAGATGALVSEPGGEERGGVEVRLEGADDVGGGDALGFVDGYLSFHSISLEVNQSRNARSEVYRIRLRRSFHRTWCDGRV